MKATLIILLQVIIISGLLYGYYHFFLRNRKFHQYNRYYLLISVLLSISIPFLNIPVYFTKEEIEPSVLLQALTSSSTAGFEENAGGQVVIPTEAWFTWERVAILFYLFVAAIIFIRVVIALIKIFRLAAAHPAEKMSDIRFINTEAPGTPFSFFRWLFWNKKIPLDSDNGRQVFRHELFHIRQKHTWDIFFLETVRMVCWVNPFFPLIAKEIKVIHEFLADQFAANKDEEWNYAELLLMQLLGSPNHRLVNPFFHNQIKRRIAMITSSQKTSYQYLRKLLVLPVAALITLLFAFNYKTSDSPIRFEKPITVVIDAGHGNGSGTIAADGTKESMLTLAVAKKIKAINTNDRINILLTRESDEDVDLKARGNFTNNHKADLFISLHLNAVNTKNESGIELFVTRKNKKFYAENKIIGAIFLNYFMNLYKTDNEIKQREEGIWVLDQSDCPALLIECGNIMNKEDLTFIKNAENQDKLANSILQSIEQFAIQKELPDFEEKKKQVSDTAKPVVNIFREATGKVAGTYNGTKITGLMIDSDKDFVTFLFGSASLTGIKGIEKELKQKYETLWDEFVSTYKIETQSEKSAEKDQEKIFEKVEVEASFPGGEAAFSKFIERFMNRKVAAEHKAPAGDYTVFIQFIVNKDGSIRDVKPLTKLGYGMEEEASKIIRKGPKWVPAMQNGKKVAAYRKERFKFTVGNDQAIGFENERVFEKVEIESSFPGGKSAWARYLEKSLNEKIPLENKAPDSHYLVIIQFIIDKSGHVSEVNALTKNGFGMEAEAIRVIKNSPRWLPALLQGQKVTSYKTVIVNFEPVDKEEENTGKK